MDVSGSMHGFPLEISKRLLTDLVGSLREKDLFNLLLFSGGSGVLSERSLPATSANVARALRSFDAQEGAGPTEIAAALRRALALPRAEGATSRILVVASDGYVDVEPETFDLVRRNLGEASVFAFGIGSSVNRHLIEGLARAGQAEAFVGTSPAAAPEAARRFREYVSAPVLTHVRIESRDFEIEDVEPRALPDLFADRPVVVFGRWTGEAKGSLVLSGQTADGPWSTELPVSDARVAPDSASLRHLWVRRRIAALADDAGRELSPGTVGAVTRLGLQYNLLTAYTAFVAVDTKPRSDGTLERVEQPLPLPAGVSDLAVGVAGVAAGFSGPVAGGVSLGIDASDVVGGGVIAAPVLPPPPPPRVVRTGGRLSAPRLVRRVEPQYPPLALQARVSGTVVLEATIGADGRITKVVVVSGHPLLRTAARDAVKLWTYTPTLLNGEPVSTLATITIHFGPGRVRGRAAADRLGAGRGAGGSRPATHL